MHQAYELIQHPAEACLCLLELPSGHAFQNQNRENVT